MPIRAPISPISVASNATVMLISEFDSKIRNKRRLTQHWRKKSDSYIKSELDRLKRDREYSPPPEKKPKKTAKTMIPCSSLTAPKLYMIAAMPNIKNDIMLNTPTLGARTVGTVRPTTEAAFMMDILVKKHQLTRTIG